MDCSRLFFCQLTHLTPQWNRFNSDPRPFRPQFSCSTSKFGSRNSGIKTSNNLKCFMLTTSIVLLLPNNCSATNCIPGWYCTLYSHAVLSLVCVEKDTNHNDFRLIVSSYYISSQSISLRCCTRELAPRRQYRAQILSIHYCGSHFVNPWRMRTKRVPIQQFDWSI